MSKTAEFTSSQNLATGALSHEITIGTNTPNVEGSFKLGNVLLKAGANISQVVTVTKTPAAGSNYATVLDTATLSSAQNYKYTPDGEIILRRGDKITLACANSGTPAVTVYSTIELIRID